MRLEAGEQVIVGAADARRGMASFDVEPIVMLQPAPPWHGWAARLLESVAGGRTARLA